MRLVGALTDAEMSSERGEYVADNSRPTQSHPQHDEAEEGKVWDEKAGFDRGLRSIPGAAPGPASVAVGVEREMTITVTPLHNFFAPRLNELPALVPSLPGTPSAIPADAR